LCFCFVFEVYSIVCFCAKNLTVCQKCDMTISFLSFRKISMSNIRDKKKNILFNYTLTSIAMYALVGLSTGILLRIPFAYVSLPLSLLFISLFIVGVFVSFCLYSKQMSLIDEYYNSKE
jgi:hypothetical protein